MSFSFTVGGTKAQTLHSLSELVHQHDSHSKPVADLVTSVVEAGPVEMTGADGTEYDAVYAVSAYGHSSAGHDLPSLGISFSSSWKLREDDGERGGIESEADPADVT
jgi:hypothetical protein